MRTKTNRTRRYSFTVKLCISMMLCLILLLLFCWAMNSLALEDYYRTQKTGELTQTYHEIETVLQQKPDRNDRNAAIDAINARTNCSIVLLNQRKQPIYVSLGGMQADGWGNVQLTFTLPGDMQNGEHRVGVEQDERIQREFIMLTGKMSDGTWCLLRSPLEALSESVAIFNRFLLYSGVIAVLLCAIIVFFMARSFTRPIAQLVDVTDSLARMDFSKKYIGKSHDEMDTLGESINLVSTELERNLSELKTANAQLQRDNEIKTRQDQLRRDFISNASHELKTPIALIRAYAEGISDDVSNDAESRRYYCDIIQDEADKMNQLIKKMTSLMQLESGEEELTITRFELTGLVNGVLRRYSILLDQKRIAFSFQYDGEMFCWGDEYFIENVINNYVSNAANHVSPKGEIVLRAESKTVDGHSRVRVSVFNTGAPIAPEDITRIWESFYKADKARTRAYGGTGLGLSVVAAIMRAHNMPCGVQNEENGVCFWFELEQA